MRLIAGHSFPDFGPCGCGIHWSTIRNATRADLDQEGIAHSGKLTSHELAQIEAERAREDTRIADAMENTSR